MKNNSTTWAKKSLINIMKDTYTVTHGTVTKGAWSLEFDANSQCVFTKTYSKGSKPLDKLKVEYFIEHNLTSRYNTKFNVVLNMQFWDKEYDEDNDEYVYKVGKCQSIQILPYNDAENKGNYKFDEIDTNGKFLKSLEVVLSYNGTSGTVDAYDVNIFRNVVEPAQVGEAINQYIDEGGHMEFNQTDLANALNQYFSGGGTINWVFPTVEEIPDVGDVPNGYACLVDSID